MQGRCSGPTGDSLPFFNFFHLLNPVAEGERGCSVILLVLGLDNMRVHCSYAMPMRGPMAVQGAFPARISTHNLLHAGAAYAAYALHRKTGSATPGVVTGRRSGNALSAHACTLITLPCAAGTMLGWRPLSWRCLWRRRCWQQVTNCRASCMSLSTSANLYSLEARADMHKISPRPAVYKFCPGLLVSRPKNHLCWLCVMQVLRRWEARHRALHVAYSSFVFQNCPCRRNSYFRHHWTVAGCIQLLLCLSCLWCVLVMALSWWSLCRRN